MKIKSTTNAFKRTLSLEFVPDELWHINFLSVAPVSMESLKSHNVWVYFVYVRTLPSWQPLYFVIQFSDHIIVKHYHMGIDFWFILESLYWYDLNLLDSVLQALFSCFWKLFSLPDKLFSGKCGSSYKTSLLIPLLSWHN